MFKVGDIVTTNSKYYPKVSNSVGVVTEVFQYSDFLIILWSDGQIRFMSCLDLEKIDEGG